MFISNAYAQAAGAGTTVGGMAALVQQLPMILMMFAVVYFIVIRPQSKRQKELKAMLDALGKGDEVVTTGGLLGKIIKISESHVWLEVGDKVEVQCQRSAVVHVLPKGTIKSA